MKNKSGISAPAVLLIVAATAVGWLVYQSSVKSPVSVSPAYSIKSVADLDQASANLDTVDVDGVGNELNQMDTDAESF